MKTAPAAAFGLLAALIVGLSVHGQQPAPAQVPACDDATARLRPRPCADWTRDCFPRRGCPDDYCPHPYPRQCWPPYLPFYRCVPAGDCGPGCGGRYDDRLTWWFLPTPRALRDALWLRPCGAGTSAGFQAAAGPHAGWPH